MTTYETATHPIVDLVIRGLHKRASDGYYLDAAQLRGVQQALTAQTVVSEVKRAVRALLQFAWLMEAKQRSPKLARALVAAIREVVVVLAARDGRLADLQNELEHAAARFAKFNGEKTTLRAPLIRRGPVAGGLRLAALVPVALR
jgi:hypothetical protein